MAIKTFLVEHYRPGLRPGELEKLARQASTALRELEQAGRPLRVLRTVIVPGDESFLSVVEASSERLVRDAYSRSGIGFDRISPSRVLADPETE
jgi:hypothetical protein